MTDTRLEYLSIVETVAATVAAKHAADVDRAARFPTESLDALRAAGMLGLVSAREVGGAGEGIGAAARVVERLARECSSTAMVVCMHYAGTAVIEKFAPEAVRRDVAAGRHLSTLAFSEAGSRSQFWAPTGRATRVAEGVRLDARKSWITSAHHATAYVWSSRPVEADAPSTLWLVPRETPGVRVDGGFDGLGLRGNDSCPATAEGAVVPEGARLGEDGKGFGIMMEVVLPWFNAMNAACSVGMMESAVARAIAHVNSVRFEHSGAALNESPVTRAQLARLRVQVDMAALLFRDTLAALETGRADAGLRVLESKAACNDAALAVLDGAMRVCGGAAFRKEVGVERLFRDARAGSVMAPTADALYDFLGKAVCGLPLF